MMYVVMSMVSFRLCLFMPFYLQLYWATEAWFVFLFASPFLFSIFEIVFGSVVLIGFTTSTWSWLISSFSFLRLLSFCLPSLDVFISSVVLWVSFYIFRFLALSSIIFIIVMFFFNSSFIGWVVICASFFSTKLS